jgi:hypothetical protein
MRLVWVNPVVGEWRETVAPAEDLTPEDRVVGAWMRYHGVEDRDRIQPCYVQVDRSDQAVLVWVVIGRTGLVVSIAEPPVTEVFSVRPPAVNFGSEPPQTER